MERVYSRACMCTVGGLPVCACMQIYVHVHIHPELMISCIVGGPFPLEVFWSAQNHLFELMCCCVTKWQLTTFVKFDCYLLFSFSNSLLFWIFFFFKYCEDGVLLFYMANQTSAPPIWFRGKYVKIFQFKLKLSFFSFCSLHKKGKCLSSQIRFLFNFDEILDAY